MARLSQWARRDADALNLDNKVSLGATTADACARLCARLEGKEL